jgi:hypothetical protein
MPNCNISAFLYVFSNVFLAIIHSPICPAKIMKSRFFYLIVFLFCSVSGVLAWDMLNRLQLTRDSDDMMINITTQALRNWDPEAVLGAVNNEFYENNSDEVFRILFSALQSLGSLNEIREVNSTVSVARIWSRSAASVATYSMQAVFDGGNAEIRISMTYSGARWEFSSYEILAPMLIA